MKVKYLILGAGPAGLSLACRLKEMGCEDFIVIDKEDEAGGLCRSKTVDGAPLDIGGGHFQDVRRPEVLDFLFPFMDKEEWNIYDRDSRIVVNNNVINSPIEANIWQMSLNDQVEYLKSIAIAGCNLDTKMPEKFTEWIYWKLGRKIAEDYMIPYNQKMFGEELNELGTYWLNKLPNVSFEETLISCLEKKAYGSQPGHATFYYPKKYGSGEIFRRMGESLKDKLILNEEISSIDLDEKTVNGKYSADTIITTIPWKSFKSIKGLSEKNLKGIESLKYTSVVIEYINQKDNPPPSGGGRSFSQVPGSSPVPAGLRSNLIYNEQIAKKFARLTPGELRGDLEGRGNEEKMEGDAKGLLSKAHWIYYPDPDLSYHRILVRYNFCPGSRGYWTETNLNRFDKTGKDEKNYFINEYAYPLNTIGKEETMKSILEEAAAKKVYGLGRWGEWQHYNSDLVVSLALQMAKKLEG